MRGWVAGEGEEVGLMGMPGWEWVLALKRRASGAGFMCGEER